MPSQRARLLRHSAAMAPRPFRFVYEWNLAPASPSPIGERNLPLTTALPHHRPIEAPHQIASASEHKLAARLTRPSMAWQILGSTSWLQRFSLCGSTATQSCQCGRGGIAAARTRQSSAARASHSTCAHCPRRNLCARHLRTLRAARTHAQRTQSERCVVLCSIDGRERALESNLSRVCRYRYICK